MTRQEVKAGEWRWKDCRTASTSSVEGAEGVTEVVMMIVSKSAAGESEPPDEALVGGFVI